MKEPFGDESERQGQLKGTNKQTNLNGPFLRQSNSNRLVARNTQIVRQGSAADLAVRIGHLRTRVNKLEPYTDSTTRHGYQLQLRLTNTIAQH